MTKKKLFISAGVVSCARRGCDGYGHSARYPFCDSDCKKGHAISYLLDELSAASRRPASRRLESLEDAVKWVLTELNPCEPKT